MIGDNANALEKAPKRKRSDGKRNGRKVRVEEEVEEEKTTEEDKVEEERKMEGEEENDDTSIATPIDPNAYSSNSKQPRFFIARIPIRRSNSEPRERRSSHL